jgi:hypothetical protein
MAENFITPEFRVSFPFVFATQKNAKDDGSTTETYSITMLFKKGEDISALKSAALNAAKERWGEDQTKWPKPLKSPFRDQGEKDQYVGYEAGAIFAKAVSYQQPGVAGPDRDPKTGKVRLITDQKEFYAGAYARASIYAKAYEGKNKSGQVVNRGVHFILCNVQKLRDGEPFGSATKAEDDFAPVSNPDTPPVDTSQSAENIFD